MRSKFFPMFIPMENRRILVVGGGSVALRRVLTLLDFGAGIRLISEEVGEELARLGREGRILVEKRTIGAGGREVLEEELGLTVRTGEASGMGGMSGEELPFCVLAATSDGELNSRIVRLCREKGIWVNNASCKEECDFYFPAIVEHGGVVMGVSSQGQSPARVREICRKLREEKDW